eukprot:416118_1
MGNCGSAPTDPDEDDDEYSITISATKRTNHVDEINTESKDDDNNLNKNDNNKESADSPSSSTTNNKAKKTKKTNSKYPWVLSSHDVKDVYQYFDVEKELGRGASCRVLKVKDKKEGSFFAMKEMRRDDKWNPMLFEQEVKILQKLSGHQNILHYEDCWMDNKNFYVLTSLCTGGELFDKIKELRHFSERHA